MQETMPQDQTAASSTAPTGDTEQWVESTATALLEEISASFLDRRPDINERNNKRIPFVGEVRVCPADSRGVPRGSSLLASGRDLSLYGLSISSTQSFEVGAYLTMEFSPPIGENNGAVTMLGKVRHVNVEDGQTLLGCQFLETLSP